MSTLRTTFLPLILVAALAPACANKSKTPDAETPESAPVTPVAEAEPAGPDNSALIAALDALDAEIETCKGKLGTKQASECADAVSAAVAALGEPIQSSTVAADLAGEQQKIQTEAEKLGKAATAGEHKDQHHHLDDIANHSKEMRSKL